MKKYLGSIIDNCKMMKIRLIKIILLLIAFCISNDIRALEERKINNRQNDKIYKRAKSLEKSGLYDEAEQLFIQIFSETPNNEKYYNGLKNFLIKKDDCSNLMHYTQTFCEAKNFDKFSKIHLMEISIICNANNWEEIFIDIKKTNLNDLKYLKKVISKLINNQQEEIALESIYDIRLLNDKNSAFYALELGYYYSSQKNYKKSLTEYLYHLEKYPKHFQMVSDRILSFPNDIKINTDLIEILNKFSFIHSKIILSDIYFKMGEIQKSIQLLKENNLFEELLSLAINLDALNYYKQSRDLYIYIIENAQENMIKQSIYQFATSLEKRASSNKSKVVLSAFMNNNPFFSSPFIRINQQESNYMYEAISLYDSLNINNKNLNALYRLSEIRFKVLGDLDNALNDYTKINKITPDRDLKLKSILGIVDILIAKGNLTKASNFINQQIDLSIWQPDDKTKLEIKLNQILFYQSKIDLTYDNLNSLINGHSVQKEDYNDILEIISLILIIKDEKDIIDKYTNAQLKINQNKRTEAITILNNLYDKTENQLFNNMINYQIATLLIYQNKTDEAIEVLKVIKDDNIYKELSVIFLAEIYDFILNDSENSKLHYLYLLQNFPLSIYYEKVRLRLNTIMEQTL